MVSKTTTEWIAYMTERLLAGKTSIVHAAPSARLGDVSHYAERLSEVAGPVIVEIRGEGWYLFRRFEAGCREYQDKLFGPREG